MDQQQGMPAGTPAVEPTAHEEREPSPLGPWTADVLGDDGKVLISRSVMWPVALWRLARRVAEVTETASLAALCRQALAKAIIDMAQTNPMVYRAVMEEEEATRQAGGQPMNLLFPPAPPEG